MAESSVPEIPRKPYYKPSEVCALTDTQPYQLRFWESELPQLSAKEGVYRREDIDLVLRIKQMLNEQDCSIGDVRSALEREASGAAPARVAVPQALPPESPGKAARPEKTRATPATRTKAVLRFDDKPGDPDRVPRVRYEDALEEVAHLRLELQESETLRRKAENATRKALEENQRLRARSETAIGNIEQLIRRLT